MVEPATQEAGDGTGLKVSPACSSFLCLLSSSSQTLGPKPQVTNKGPHPQRIIHLVCHTTIHRTKVIHNLTDRDKSSRGSPRHVRT